MADPEKVEAIQKWPKPITVKALRGFLELTGCYWHFIKWYGLMAAPLNYLLKKDSFRWTKETQRAFKGLKTAVSSPPILTLPDFSQPFEVECKAVIMVVVDRLTKYSYFSALPHSYTAAMVADTFVREVAKLHGTPRSLARNPTAPFHESSPAD
ncbi:PREDICTED: uncharacterized protein LOC109113969 [Nelumbo nucifera]|uniref:Uncharacterized protein LOC109113969 n=1 Tax=Nelumbo nucifera TaxID=4432 RepID=A0A1U8Q0H0_NELNU|nr:PREDICTED: uncharacterized protein LOC109113969 [Nelumbo nucifera]